MLGNGEQIVGQQLVVLIIVVTVAIFTGFDLYDLGVSKTVNPIVAFIVGFIVYFVVLLLIELTARILGIRKRLHDASFETMRLIWPRHPTQKVLAIVGVCLLNPFTEEMIYRGVLVHFFGKFNREYVDRGVNRTGAFDCGTYVSGTLDSTVSINLPCLCHLDPLVAVWFGRLFWFSFRRGSCAGGNVSKKHV